MKNTFLILAVIVAAVGCGPGGVYRPGWNEPQNKVTALDAVKFISTTLSKGDDPRSFGQRTYDISRTGRVLLRYETLNDSKSKIDEKKPIRVTIYAPDSGNQDRAKAHLQVCPILRDWWMGASWNYAYPFPGGDWTPGGAVEWSDCVNATATDCSETNAVCYDVSAWFNAYVLQRGVNFGLALVVQNNVAVTILGDGAGSRVPRISWTQWGF